MADQWGFGVKSFLPLAVSYPWATSLLISFWDVPAQSLIHAHILLCHCVRIENRSVTNNVTRVKVKTSFTKQKKKKKKSTKMRTKKGAGLRVGKRLSCRISQFHFAVTTHMQHVQPVTRKLSSPPNPAYQTKPSTPYKWRRFFFRSHKLQSFGGNWASLNRAFRTRHLPEIDALRVDLRAFSSHLQFRRIGQKILSALHSRRRGK